MTAVPGRETLWPWLFLAALVAVGTWLRFDNLALISVWFDEAASWYQSKDGIADLIVRTANDNYPPLHNFILYATIKLLGDSEWALRAPSAILGAANIGLLYWLGAITVGRSAGLLAAALLTFSGYHIEYSQEARMYTLLAFTATWFAASSFYFFQSPSIVRGALVCVSALSLLYTHAYGPLNWLAIAVAFSACLFLRADTSRRTLKIWAASNALAIVGFMPWGWVILTRAAILHHQGFWIPDPTPELVLEQLLLVAGGASFATLLAVGTTLAVLPSRAPENGETSKPACSPIPVLLLWAVLPAGIGLLASVVILPVFLHRYLIGALPALCLIAAYGLTRFARGRPALAIVFATSTAILVANVVNHKPAPKQDWRGVAAFLERKLNASDCVLVFERHNVTALHYYHRETIDCIVLPWHGKSRKVGEIESDRVFAIISHANGSKRKKLSANFKAAGWSLAEKFKFQEIDVRLYEPTDRGNDL